MLLMGQVHAPGASTALGTPSRHIPGDKPETALGEPGDFNLWWVHVSEEPRREGNPTHATEEMGTSYRPACKHQLYCYELLPHLFYLK